MRSRDTLLLAAEDPAVRAALREILRSDYNLLEAEDRHQAKLLLEQNRDCLAAAALSLSLPGEDPLPQALREGQIPLLFLLPDGSRQAAERALSLGASDVLAPPFLPALVRQRTRNAAELCRHEHHLEELVEEQAQTLRHSNQAVVDALSSIIEFRSAESGRHVLRLRRLTQILLEDVAKSCPEYGLTERDIRGISSAASLHDIGKIAIPDAILNKNQPLSPQEFEVMKTHTLSGSRMLENLSGAADRDYLRYAYNICRYHHERWDGRGYPEGLRGDQIPICAQVVGLADAFDALTSDRSYKAAYPYERAVNMILAGECGTFSPRLLECFKHVRGQFAELVRCPEEDVVPGDLELPAPESAGQMDTLQLLRNKYQALLHYTNATVVEVDFDQKLHHTVYNPDPDFPAMHPDAGGWSFPQAKIHPEDQALLERMARFLRTEFLEDGMYRCGFYYRAWNPRLSEYQRCHVTVLRLDTGDAGQHSALVVWRREPGRTDPGTEMLADPFGDTPEALLGLLSVVVLCRFDAHLTILRCGSSLPYLLGYSREELRACFHDQLMELILPEDRRDVERQLREQLKGGTLAELEFRVRTGQGETLWILAKTRITAQADGSDLLYCCMVDNSRAKRGQEVLRQALARNQIMAEQSNDILFEWEPESGRLSFSHKWEERFGYPPAASCPKDEIPMAAYIHPDDLRALRALSGDLEGKAYLETEARIVTAQGRYRWNRLRLSFLRSEDGSLGTVVGVLMDIDQEKRDATALRKKAEEDPLTGLLNKNFTHARIAAALESQPEGTLSALLILDMDNFKQVNDRCGHPYGDTVLTWAAERLRHFFRSGDIIGRIGGDEFMIFLKNVPDTALVEKRCQALLRAMSSLLDGRDGAVRLSCSLGVALAPEHGRAFQELFQRADNALYQAKALGKNGYVIYSEASPGQLPRQPSAAGTRIESDRTEGGSRAELLRFTLRCLCGGEDPERAVLQVLEAVGRATHVSRAYIFENNADNTRCSNTFEWCREGVTPEKENLRDVDLTGDFADWFDRFDERGVFYCPDISVLPPALRDFLARQGIRSTLQCGIREDGVDRGFLGFDDCESDRLWTREETELLQTVGEILSLLLPKKRRWERTERRTEELSALLDRLSVPAAVLDPERREILWENPAAGESAAWRDAPGVPVTWEGKPALLLTASEREK